jgi:hypothetical protein
MLPVLAAGIAGSIAAAVIVFLPDWRLERLAWDMYLDRITDAAKPPLGLKARLIMALAAGGMAAGLTGALAWIFGGILGGKAMGLSLPNWKFWERSAAKDDAETAAPIVRRRDFHPDAPQPRPVLAHEELGAPLPPVPSAAVQGSPLVQKNAVRVVAVMPQADPVDWSMPDDVLDLGMALSLTEEETMSAGSAVHTQANSAPVSATGIQFPNWAYEEGQRMAKEDPDYAANAVELARRIHPPTPLEDMVDLPPLMAPEVVFAPQSAAEIMPQAEDTSFAETAAVVDTASGAAFVSAPVSAPVANETEAPDFAAQSAPVYADASIDAMIDRLERALARLDASARHEFVQKMAPATMPEQGQINTPSAAHDAQETGDDPALDAALSTLARMNRQAFG